MVVLLLFALMENSDFHIRGKLRKKVWITPGDIILVDLRDYQDEKADVILKYTPDEARILKNAGHLPESTKLNEGEEEDAGGVEFIDSGEHFSEDEVAAQDRNFSLSESSEDKTEEEEDDGSEEETKIKVKGKLK